MRARHLAWLHATPKTPTSRAVAGMSEAPKSRLKRLQEQGVLPQMPEVCCDYLFQIFLEVGPASSSGFTRSRISQVEIAKWQENMAVKLAPWECRTLLRLSEAWIEEASAAEDPKRPPPYMEAPTQAQRDRVDQMIDSVL